ncbi:unnamed protein product [Brassica oleracea]
MEEPFLPRDEELVPSKTTWQRGQLTVELKKLSLLAAPMAIVTIAEYLLPVISVIVAGHNGELQLSGVALATSFTNVSGFSILYGLVGALETLCGQAFGAKRYEIIGTYTYSAIASNIPICFLISILWIYIEKLLVSLGQDPDISRVAGSYAFWLIPGLFGQAIVIPLTRYLQTQALVLPLLYTAVATLLFHVPVCWTMVSVFGLGSNGAALAISVSFWFYALILACYVRFSTSCEKTRGLISDDFVSCVKQFFQYGIPSAAMVCLEWWLFELLVLWSGLLPNPKLETSVLSICFTTAALHYVIPGGVAAAVSTRVSNNLGAGNPQVARLSVFSGLCLWLVESIFFTTLLFTCKNIIGCAFSNSKEVVDYVADLAPLLCLSFILDGFTAILNGVARGSGWQHIGAWNNVVAYYLIGAPVGVYLAFYRHFNGKGLWSGVVVGSAVQAIVLSIVISSMNWKEQVFVKPSKSNAYFKRYQVKFRRRRDGKTDYRARIRLINQDKNKYNTPKYRFVVRFTNKDIVAQIVSASIAGDIVKASAYAHELPQYGLTVGLTNYAAAYCTGLLLARRVLKMLEMDEEYEGNLEATGEDFSVEPTESRRPFRALLDVGLIRTTTGNRVFGALKGALDGGLDIPHSDKRFAGFNKENKQLDAEIHRNYIYGGHVSNYMKMLNEDEPEKFQTHFSQYLKKGVDAESMEELYKKVHAAIRADPNPKKTEKPAPKAHKRYNLKKLTYEERKNKLIERVKALNGAAGGDDDDEDDEE